MLSRQRIRQALMRVTHEECSACTGTGRRRLLSGLSLRVLREMQARVSRSRGRGGLEVRAPVAIVEWLKKHRSTALRDLRQVCTGPVRLEADARLPGDGWAMKGLAPDGPLPRGPAPGSTPKP
jgi:Ribonuclease G/E